MRDMERSIGMAVIFSMAILSTTLYAAEGGAEGAGTRRRVSIHPVGTVHRMGDWLATRHMPKEERQAAMEQRRAERQVRHAEEKVKRDQRWEERRAILDADKKQRARP